MPDDEKTEVTEQLEKTPSGDEIEGDDSSIQDEDFSGGFESVAEPEKEKTEEKKDEKPKTEKPKRGRPKKEVKPKEEPLLPEKEKEREAEEEKEEEAEKEPDEEDLDEDEKRGREILEAEKKTREDEKVREEAEKTKRAEETKRKGDEAFPPSIEITPDIANAFLSLADPKLLPENLKVGDTDLGDLRAFAEANPEMTVIAGSLAANMINRLLHQGVLIDTAGVKALLEQQRSSVDDRFFDFQVRSMLPSNADPSKIWESKEFKDYHGKASDAFKAFFRSDDPADHARGFKVFLAKTTEAVKDKAKEVDEQSRTEKKKHDDLHGSTIRSRRPSVSDITTGDIDDDFDAGFMEALEKK